MTSTKIDTFHNECGSKNLIFSPLQMKTNQKPERVKLLSRFLTIHFGNVTIEFT